MTTKPITAGELRIGNLVLDSTKNTTIVESIIPEHNRIRYGIPLSESWLERAGFINHSDEDSEWWEMNMPFIGDICTCDKERGNYLFDVETDKLRVYYIHQLQNLYWCLCGTELTFKQ